MGQAISMPCYRHSAAAEFSAAGRADSIKVLFYDESNAGDIARRRMTDLRDVFRDAYRESFWTQAMPPELREWYAQTNEKVWLNDATIFYVDQAKEGKACIVIAEHAPEGKILGAFFMLKGEVFMESAEPGLRSDIAGKLNVLGAAPSRIIYGAEMFTAPDAGEFCGTRRAVMGLMFDRYRDYAMARSFTHSLIWTLDARANPMLDVARALGFRAVPGGKAEHGIELGLLGDGDKYGYVTAKEGPAVYLYAQLRDKVGGPEGAGAYASQR